MNLDEDSGLSVSCGNGKLRQWLIDQIDSRRYPGLVWENDEKTIFRIPWKHAGKQDYNREEDAALFKAWALFKGKFKEGVDKPDPPTWKTRLRCALNKSNDFDELVERSQLDISEPYKVYQIIPEGAKKGMKMSSMEEMPSHANALGYIPPYPSLHNQVPAFMVSQERRDWRDYHAPPEQQPLPNTHHHGPHAELPYGQCHYPSPISRPWPGSHTENGFQLSFHTYFSESQSPVYAMDHNNAVTDFSLHVSLFYRESLVKEVTTTSPEGCRITSSSSSSPSSSSSSSSPCPEDKFHSGAEIILFPFPYPESQRQGADMLPNVLERGVLLWMAPDGLYAKRLCQGRVYWEGPLAPYTDKPNKLEKEQPCKLFDTQQFLIELQDFAHNGRHVPRHQVVLCFGDEYPDPQRPRKMITAQVEPVFARKLVYYYQQNNGHYLRAYDHIQEQNASPTVDYPSQRPLQHIQE
ncbi:interferon regulatory factor 4-like [Stegastes partitus]|uniref:Interferon regulatory factor 4-like n=1 Tax=Stegastes partitus TaxID=144197 RepID=A0A3B5AVR8_9TELE|nr:PREDICTED: interferon regulatory factor 4-like [Stegastes partitus]XP_008295731.1 PREDICTED: interferon regulatory factor 4-like [Stegastes partitus]XP_008298200.1 PREDICTED: interferon regulatory factor 4-like [Stegastes partitus]XP_008298202.1 PREDICTED: interferon regulatory factor 4-like [Stegastes partitus]